MQTSQADNLSSQPTAATASAYVPGVCNINTAEIASRRRAGYALLAISLLATIVLVTLGYAFDWTRYVRLVLFLPFFVTAVCLLQVKYKFCVNYGANGMQNAAEGDTVAQDIVDAAARKLDMARTRKIKLQGAGIAAAITVLLLALPT